MLENSHSGMENFHNLSSMENAFSKLISYNEMQLSALILLSSHTYFISFVKRDNSAKYDNTNNYTICGVYIGAIGAGFKVLEKMEWKTYYNFRRAK